MASDLTPSATNVTTTTTTESTSVSSNSSNVFHLLEVTLISAQDLAPISSKSNMKTYSVVSIQPDHKLNSRVDSKGRANPTWNDKFMFRVETEFLGSESSNITVEIYSTSWFRDSLLGTVEISITELIPPSAYQVGYHNQDSIFTRFVALQIRRPSGNPQGILNMAVTLFPFGPPVYQTIGGSNTTGYKTKPPVGKRVEMPDDGEEIDPEETCRLNQKIHLWRSRSQEFTDLGVDTNSDSNFRSGSILNGSMVNSDIGPSASIVAEAIAKGTYQPQPQPTKPLRDDKKRGVGVGDGDDMDDRGSSILEDLTQEEANTRGYKATMAGRWPTNQVLESSVLSDSSGHERRHSDVGLFSCFAYGMEFTIVCGANNAENNVKKKVGEKTLKRYHSQQELSTTLS